jgi:hypothetical protein
VNHLERIERKKPANRIIKKSFFAKSFSAGLFPTILGIQQKKLANYFVNADLWRILEVQHRHNVQVPYLSGLPLLLFLFKHIPESVGFPHLYRSVLQLPTSGYFFYFLTDKVATK